jgi:fluoroquinolone transport system permease protein
MNSRLMILIKGELQRLHKYNVTTISFVVALVWFLLLYFIDDADLLKTMLPFVIIVDATMMSTIFIGAIMFFEKTESTLSTLLVTPVKSSELVLSKVIANTFHSVLSSLLVIIVFYFVKDVSVNFFYITLALIVSVFFHSLLGFVFSFHSKDFTSMLVNVMIYAFIFLIPSSLHLFNIVFKGKVWDYVLMISPTQSAMELITLGFSSEWTLLTVIGLVILVLGSIFGYRYYVLPKFKEYAVKQSGV